jgi:dihydrofolate reductase
MTPKRPHLTAIVAMTPDRVIGRDGGLPWHLPGDLAFFKRTTRGHTVVMGRKTWESIGRPLPHRRNIVLTRDRDWSAPGAEVIHSPEELIPLLGNSAEKAFIIGGAEIYAAYLPVLDDLLISHVVENHPGDTFFPPFEDQFPNASLIEAAPGFVVRRWSR